MVRAQASATSASSACASSGSATTTGPGRPEVAVWNARADELGDPGGVVHRRHPLRHLAEHARVVELLERLAAEVAPRHLADEQDQRRRVLVRGVHADRGVGRARARA